MSSIINVFYVLDKSDIDLKERTVQYTWPVTSDKEMVAIEESMILQMNRSFTFIIY